LEPNAQQHYVEMRQMVKKSTRFNHTELKSPLSILLDWLDIDLGDRGETTKALGKMSSLFSSDFIGSEAGADFKDSLLFNQEERARQFPDIRSHLSNKYLPAGFWSEYDTYAKTNEDLEGEPPERWDLAIRPTVAHRKSNLPSIPYMDEADEVGCSLQVGRYTHRFG